MRRDCAVNLVSGALQSSLARAQAAYEFHGKNSTYNSEESKKRRKKLKASAKLAAHCESIGSNFATLTIDQLEEYGKDLKFTDGGILPPLITEELQSKYTVLRDDVGPPPGVVWLPSYPFNYKRGKKASTNGVAFVDTITPLILKNKKEAEVPTTITNSRPNSGDSDGELVNGTDAKLKSKSVIINGFKPIPEPDSEIDEKVNLNLKTTGGSKVSLVAQKIKRLHQLLEGSTVGKKKKKVILRRIRKLQKKQEDSDIVDTQGEERSENKDTNSNKSSLVNNTSKLKLISNLVSTSFNHDASVESLLKSKKSQKLALVAKKMGPESARNGEVMTNGTSPSSNHQLPQPKRVLFPKDRILLGWRSKRNPGAGFHNFGNTCYLNSSLQALFHVPAFVNWLQNEEDHRSICNANNNYQSPCILCVVYITLQEHSKTMTPIRPRVLDKLKAICKHFGYGRQEDAHEFLRYLLEGMEKSYLMAINGLKLDNRTKETNPLGQIFGGYIRTEVTCSKCNFVSTTFQPSSELQLDIRHITTLEDALTQHFRKERLDNNDYKCEKCRTISQATKQFSIEVPPLVLCLQLKRFTLYGTKISKRIHCNRYVNMSKFIHKSRREAILGENTELKYRLVALVTHMGQSPNCGHYTAIAECSNGMYYQFDDQSVYQVSQQSALNNDAYVIIYEMDRSSRPNTAAIGSTASASSTATSTIVKQSIASSVNKPLMSPKASDSQQKKFTIPFAKTNGNINGTTPSSPQSTKVTGSNVFSNMDRKLLEFGRSQLSSPSTTSPSPKKIQLLKPGVALTNTQKLLPSSTAVVTKNSGLKLVPYNDIENEESDKEDQVPTESTPEISVPASSTLIGPMNLPPSIRPKIPAGVTAISVSDNPFKKSKSPDTPEPSPDSRKRSADNPQISKSIFKQLALDSGDNLSLKPSTSPKLSATSKWTVTPNKKSNICNGYLSDPESKLKSKELKAKFSRAKSMERDLTKPTDSAKIKISAPLVPNKILNGTSDSHVNSSNQFKKLTPGQQDEHTPNSSYSSDVPCKKRKRLTSSSSSSSSSSSDSVSRKRKKKHVKKKEKRKHKRSSSTSSSSSSDSDDSRGSRRRKSRKHKKKNHDSKKEDKSNRGKDSKDHDHDRSISRETDSEERDRIRRKARNPSRSRSPLRSQTSTDGEKEKFDPSKLDSRARITGWDGQPTLLSKHLDETKRQPEKTREEILDEELDQGKVKKIKKSKPPSRDGDNVKRFQIVQERKSSHRSTKLDDYGFKVHRSHESSKWEETKSENGTSHLNERHLQHGFGTHHHRNNNHRHFGNFKNSHGSHNHNRYDKNRNWGYRNHR